jgi:uncharacterized protein
MRRVYKGWPGGIFKPRKENIPMEPTKALEERLPELYKDNSCDHDLGHIRRVVRNARLVGEREGADLSVLLPAAMLHDIALRKGSLAETNEKHAVLGAERARGILKGLGFKNIEKICSTIMQHSLDSPTKEPRTMEGDCLFDADKLDAITPVGAIRYFQERALAKNTDPVKAAEYFLKWLENFGFRTKTARDMGSDRKDVLDFCRKVIESGKV